MGTLYALGHAAVVIVLGLLAIWFGTLLPEWVDGYMESAVGVTLLLLGVWLIWSMSRNNGRLVMRSRWMIVFDLGKSAYRKINPKNSTKRTGDNTITTDTAKREYGSGASVSIGVIHGIGAETGSQALLLAAAAGATSALTGSFLLIAFVVGLVVSNTLIAIATTAGLLGTDRHHKFHTALGIVICATNATENIRLLAYVSKISHLVRSMTIRGRNLTISPQSAISSDGPPVLSPDSLRFRS